jgi:hypothetical protein
MHWTYEICEGDSDLHQGDILEPNESLLSLFKDEYPQFTNQKYRGFLVITQTCDLVRRKELGNECSATHVGLSAILSIQDVISDSLKNRFGYLAPEIYARDMRKAVEGLMERIINQNENSLGLFYLHPNLDSGITVPSVAVLRMAITVSAAVHYPTLQKARVGRLSKQFEPKLGWMVGNLYSRVGVPDWKEKSAEGIEESIIREILSPRRQEPIWLERKVHKKILKQHPNFGSLSQTEQEKIINQNLPKPPKDRALEIITETVKKVVPKAKAEELESIKNRLSDSEEFEAQMRKFSLNQ